MYFMYTFTVQRSNVWRVGTFLSYYTIIEIILFIILYFVLRRNKETSSASWKNVVLDLWNFVLRIKRKHLVYTEHIQKAMYVVLWYVQAIFIMFHGAHIHL